MKKMILAVPFAVLLACNTSRNATTTTDADMTNDASVTGTTAMTGDMTDTTITGTESISTNGTTGVYTSGSATVNANSSNIDYNTMNNGSFNSRNNWNGDQTYVIQNNTTSDVNNPWTSSPRNNWYNRYNTTGDNWMSVYYQPTDVTETGMMRDTSSVFGGWQLTMTPDLATAWRNDLNESGYVFTNLNNNGNNAFVSGSATVGNSSMNGSVSGSAMNGSSTMTGAANNSMGTTGTGSMNNSSMNGTVSGSTDMGASTMVWNNTNGGSPNMYAANGNMYNMPRMNLYLMNGSFAGFTGCNNISGRLNVGANNMVSFANTTPSTTINCAAGFDQNVLLERLKRVDNYAIAGNQLQLRQGDQVLLVFDRNANQ